MKELPIVVQRIAANLEEQSLPDVLRFTAALLECSRELLLGVIADKTIRVEVDCTFRSFIRNLHDRAGELEMHPYHFLKARGQA